MASSNPLLRVLGRSIWVMSPVTTVFELKPMRVTNIFICPEHDVGADEDVRHPHGLQFEDGSDRRHHPDRSAQHAQERVAGSHGYPGERGGALLQLFH